MAAAGSSPPLHTDAHPKEWGSQKNDEEASCVRAATSGERECIPTQQLGTGLGVPTIESDQPATVQVADLRPHPESTQDTEPSMDVESDWNKQCLAAAQYVAEKLAQEGEQGFEHLLGGERRPPGTVCPSSIKWDTLVRLALCADCSFIDADIRKQASHCGGVPPEPARGLKACKGTEFVADPGNKVYFHVVRKLLDKCEALRATAPQSLVDQIDHLAGMAQGLRGDCIEAALAAAEYAHRVEHGKPITWKWLIGGAYATGDLPI